MRLTVRGLGGAVCFLRADLTGRAPYMLHTNKLCTDNRQHDLKLTMSGLGGVVCFLRAELTGKAPYMLETKQVTHGQQAA